ncbi:hypothetical protein JCM8097_002494 [Rhodosporidiobolus ruineniae]
MLASTIAIVLSAAGCVAASPAPYADALVAHQVNSLAKRASSPASSSYLADIFSMTTSRCSGVTALNDLTACSKNTNQATIAACACSSVTLGDLRTTASCISTTTTSSANATAVVNAYNSFVDLCTNEGLAKVTGTVEVGASTRSMARPSSTVVSSASASSRATYNPSAAPASTATVPSLIASGSIASSARVAAASAASVSAAGASASPTSGAGRVAASLLAVAGAVVGFAALA